MVSRTILYFGLIRILPDTGAEVKGPWLKAADESQRR